MGFDLACQRGIRIDFVADGVVALLERFYQRRADACEGIQDAHPPPPIPYRVKHSGNKRPGKAGDPWHPAMEGTVTVLRESGITKTRERKQFDLYSGSLTGSETRPDPSVTRFANPFVAACPFAPASHASSPVRKKRHSRPTFCDGMRLVRAISPRVFSLTRMNAAASANVRIP